MNSIDNVIVKAHSPGKLIFSGEHSIVYGAPAIVAAIARYTTVGFTPLSNTHSIHTFIEHFPHIAEYPLRGLSTLKQKLDQRFEQFLNGQRPVQNILNRPEDLIIYTLANFAQHIPVPGPRTRFPLPNPGKLQTNSELPLGAGMGSSAAAIAATIVLYESLLNHPLSLEQRFERIRFCERLQHGKGSAIDATAVTYGNIHLLSNHQPIPIKISLSPHWYSYLQGIPCVSTGEVVNYVRVNHAHDQKLWEAFQAITLELCEALQSQKNPIPIIKENHQLLCRTGVVPVATQKLIEKIEEHGGAAKISGAGAHLGQNAGMLLIYHPEVEHLKTIIPNLDPLVIAPNGAELIT
ncbi:mevalonate kinase family protein [Suttonella ornithocola]|uniref:mevalonate kinase n=1 Tax=Suttonella ornithocola TaxID=279832 RepID=A0A380MW86_9GAMM|nr:GHMP kinase [Suttonella ornithocola]SUO96558.1 mevalonate kinase [Suttonella ornithocola]